MNYKQALSLWQENKELNWTPELIKDVQESYEVAILALHKKLFNRKAKDFSKAWNHLKSEFENELRETQTPFENESKSRYEALKAKKELNEKDLELFARGFTPEKQSKKFLLKISEAWAYHTQGWGANKYARQALNEDIKFLEILGFECEVKTVNQHNTGGQFSSYHEDYQLWANITEFDFYLLKKSGKFISVLNWAFLCWKSGTNPKVYFQFLSQDDYDKSQVMAYHTRYELTADNMELELSWDEINRIKIS